MCNLNTENNCFNILVSYYLLPIKFLLNVLKQLSLEKVCILTHLHHMLTIYFILMTFVC